MIYKHANWSMQTPPLRSGDTVEDSNLYQLISGTGVNAAGVVFRNCNLTNCNVTGAALIENSNTSQIDLCYWLHRDKDLPAEPDNCRHVVDTDTIEVDGVVIATEYTRKDTVL